MIKTLYRSDIEHLRSVFMAVENGDIGMLKSLGIKVNYLTKVPKRDFVQFPGTEGHVMMFKVIRTNWNFLPKQKS